MTIATIMMDDRSTNTESAPEDGKSTDFEKPDRVDRDRTIKSDRSGPLGDR
jgi:hypothetical protein